MQKMLVVEDDDLSQKVLRKIFKAEFEIDVCESADEFYEKYNNILRKRDAVLTWIINRGGFIFFSF